MTEYNTATTASTAAPAAATAQKRIVATADQKKAGLTTQDLILIAVLLAAGCSLILCYTRKLGVPRWLTLIGLIYCSTSYVMFGSVATMGKDSLHTIFLMPFAVIFVEACLTRGRVLARTPVAVCFVLLGFAVIASKRAALVVVVCAGLLLVAVCAKGLRGRATTCLVAAIVIAECAFAPIAAAVTHANHSIAREVWGYVTQPVARLAHDEPHAISPPISGGVSTRSWTCNARPAPSSTIAPMKHSTP